MRPRSAGQIYALGRARVGGHLPLIGAGVAAAAVGAVAYKLLANAKDSAGGGPLSARRQFVLDEIAKVVPSQYGDAKFTKIAPGYDADDASLPHGFTTCGYLPCHVGRMLKVANCITQGGLEQMRTNGRKDGSWVDANGKNRPRPGDLYAIGSDKLIVHVGVIIDPSGPIWKTADAGQGSIGAGQQANYLSRPYDPSGVTLGGPAGPRKLAGWIDIDKVPGATP